MIAFYGMARDTAQPKREPTSGSVAPPEEAGIFSIAFSGVPCFRGPIAADNDETIFELWVERNVLAAQLADIEWGRFVYTAIKNAIQPGWGQDEVESLLTGLPIHDSHWRWGDKVLCLNKPVHRWFFLMESGVPQAICLTSHPLGAKIGTGDVFHVEFIAVAPWNRACELWKRTYKGLGTGLLIQVCQYHQSVSGLRPGFSLDSVPQAADFYSEFGLARLPEFDHDGLLFFEMAEEDASSLVGGSANGYH